MIEEVGNLGTTTTPIGKGKGNRLWSPSLLS